MNSFQETTNSFQKTTNSSKNCSQLDQLKAALDEKRPELVNRKRIIFHQDNAWPHVSLMTRQKLLLRVWEVLIHRHIHQTLHLWISVYFGLYKILLMEKISIPWKTVKGSRNSSLLKKIKSFGKMELYEVAWKMAEGSGTKVWIRSSIKFLVKMKNVSSIFT